MPGSTAPSNDARLALAAQHALHHRERRIVVVLAPETQGMPAPGDTTLGPARLSTPQTLETTPPTERFDLAIVAEDALPPPTAAEAGGLLGSLRDRWARETLVVCDPRTTRWQFADLLAFGFERTPTPNGIGFDLRPATLYRVSLHDYKHTPDWLNPRFWAHPARWDRDFW